MDNYFYHSYGNNPVNADKIENPIIGQTHYCIYNNRLYTFDGNGWVEIISSPNISLTDDEILFLHNQYTKHKHIERLRKEYPSLDEAMNNVDIILALIKE